MGSTREAIKALLGKRLRQSLKRRALRVIAPELEARAFNEPYRWTPSSLPPHPDGCAHERVKPLRIEPRRVLRCQDCGVAFAAATDPFDDQQSEFWDQEAFESIYSKGEGRLASYWSFLICRVLLMHGCRFWEHEPPNPRALEVGCGGGYFLHLLQNFFQMETRGIEPSEWGRRHAREEFGLNGVTQASAPSEAGLADGSFGLVVLCHVLEHVPEPFGLLGEIFRSAAPGGLFYGEVPDSAALQDYSWPEHRWFFDEPSLDFHLRSAGFEVLAIFPGRTLPWPEAIPFFSWLARRPEA